VCVCLWAGVGKGSREGIVYLYNLSNSPVLISEGPPSIYLDYPCGSAASFLLLSLLLLGCVYIKVILVSPAPGTQGVLRLCHSALPSMYGSKEGSVWVPCFPQRFRGRASECSLRPSDRQCWPMLRWRWSCCQHHWFRKECHQTFARLFPGPPHVETET
jgi:hypothetical protein